MEWKIVWQFLKKLKLELLYYPGEGNGTLLQYSCLENPTDWGAWWAAVHGVAIGQTRLHFHFHFSLSCIGEGNGNPLQCSCLENPRDGGACWAAIYGVAQSGTRLKRFSSSSTLLSSNSTSEYISKRIESRDLKSYLYTNVPNSIIHNSQKMEIAQVSIDG